MKPFNLDAALRGEKVVMRDGREVISVQDTKCRLGIIAEYVDKKGNISFYARYREDGRHFYEETPQDLFMEGNDE